jgi:hypothetical protein
MLACTLSNAAKVNSQRRQSGVVKRRGSAKHDLIVHRAAAEWVWMEHQSHGSGWTLPRLFQNRF